MITLPDFERAFSYENDFYLSCDPTRIGKMLAHYELFKMIPNIPGAIVECGVFKGTSLVRFAMLRHLFGNTAVRKIIGFDVFGKFPETNYEADRKPRQKFVDDAGAEGISTFQLTDVLKRKGVGQNVELIAGDILQTVPEYVAANPALKIVLLNLDTDIYEPAVTILKYLYPRLVVGGVLLLDDYGVFPGETKAVDDFFAGTSVRIEKFPFSPTPCYIVKT